MTEFSNPELPDGVNVSKTHPLVDFARLLGGIAASVFAIVVALMLAADYLAKYIPFSAEVKVASRFDAQLAKTDAVTAYLQAIVDRLSLAHSLPGSMRVRVHYSDGDITNAFATLGGHVVVYRGLVRRLNSENALAMVLSHEIAHVKLRHPVSALGRGVVLGVAIGSVSAATGSDIAGRVLGNAGLLTALSFSRSQESEADAHAIAALARVYGHVNGADELFRVLSSELEKQPAQLPAFLRTHPLDVDRIDALSAIARERRWPAAGELTPLPEDIMRQILATSD